MATSKGIKFYSKAYGESKASSLSSNSGAIVFDKTSHAIYVDGVKYGSNVTDATFSSNKLTITKVGDTIELDFSSLATTASVVAAFNEIKGFLTMDDGAGAYVAQADQSYVSSDTFTSVNTTNVIDTTGSDATMVGVAVAMVDKKAKATLNEVISAKKEIDAVETGAGLGEDGAYTANTSANYIKNASSLKDADEKLDAQLKSVSDAVAGLTSGTVTDVKINGSTVKNGTVAEIAVEGTYDSTSNMIATKSTVSGAIDTFKNGLTGSATIASKNGNVVTIKTGVTETDGKISNNSGTDIVLKEVAVTGAAVDVTIADDGDKIGATTVEDALQKLATSIETNKITIADGEKIISKSASKELSSTLTVDIEKQGEADYIVLKGINGAEISKVDASAFVVDGMLENAELVTTAESDDDIQTPYIKLTFNTDSGKQPISFSVSSLVDTYTSGNSTALTVSGYTITPNTGAVAENAGTLTTGGHVYTAIAATKGQDIQTITGETATTQGEYINVKVTATKGASDDNYTLSTTSNVTTQAVSSADASNKGLAEASDVKSYVDAHKATVTNAGATISVNDSNATTIATVDKTNITAKVSFTWEEYE